jgi:hypothetical protein
MLSTVLAPVSQDYVPMSYYELVRDIGEMRKTSWNMFTLDCLKASLTKFKEGSKDSSSLPSHWPSSNLALLQVWNQKPSIVWGVLMMELLIRRTYTSFGWKWLHRLCSPTNDIEESKESVEGIMHASIGPLEKIDIHFGQDSDCLVVRIWIVSETTVY